jgi:hypothetical protein
MKFLNNSLILITIAAIALFLTACGSGHDHGPTPAGLNLVLDGEVIASQEGTTITYHGDADFIPLTSGQTTGTIEVQWFLESGEVYNYTTDDGYSLIVNITNADVLSINHPVGGNQWHMQLEGVSEGTSGFSLDLFHVDHTDFESRTFNVQVTEPAVD